MGMEGGSGSAARHSKAQSSKSSDVTRFIWGDFLTAQKLKSEKGRSLRKGISRFESTGKNEVCGLEARDTADWKSALQPQFVATIDCGAYPGSEPGGNG